MSYSELRLKRLIEKASRERKLMSHIPNYDFSKLLRDELIELIEGIENQTITDERINDLLNK